MRFILNCNWCTMSSSLYDDIIVVLFFKLSISIYVLVSKMISLLTFHILWRVNSKWKYMTSTKYFVIQILNCRFIRWPNLIMKVVDIWYYVNGSSESSMYIFYRIEKFRVLIIMIYHEFEFSFWVWHCSIQH